MFPLMQFGPAETLLALEPADGIQENEQKPVKGKKVKILTKSTLPGLCPQFVVEGKNVVLSFPNSDQQEKNICKTSIFGLWIKFGLGYSLFIDSFPLKLLFFCLSYCMF